MVFLEITQGPFIKEDTIFAEWSPREDEINQVNKFFEKILERTE